MKILGILAIAGAAALILFRQVNNVLSQLTVNFIGPSFDIGNAKIILQFQVNNPLPTPIELTSITGSVSSRSGAVLADFNNSQTQILSPGINNIKVNASPYISNFIKNYQSLMKETKISYTLTSGPLAYSSFLIYG
jgi:hypothetical protein